MTRHFNHVVKRVVKLGGRAQSSDILADRVAAAWRANPNIAIVHGGGDEISDLQRKLGSTPSFTGGRRVTTAEDLDVIRMVLSGVVNKRLVARFNAGGVPSVGISGEDASLISATPLGITEFGYVGMPSRIDTRIVEMLWQSGYMPVISPLASNANDRASALNVNGDDAAAAIAVALGADELLLVADVRGVLDANGDVIEMLGVDDARELIARGVAQGGMAAKLEAAHAAVAGGVERVRIASIAALDDASCGTFVSKVGARNNSMVGAR